MASPLARWPWAPIGNYKYYLFLPILALAIYENLVSQNRSRINWHFHILIISALRYLHYQAWMIASRLHCVVKKYRIRFFGTDFQQVDREFHSDNWIIFQALVGFALSIIIPSIGFVPIWKAKGFIYLILFHMGATEPMYYWAHRALHRGELFARYHQVHHQSDTPEPSTAGTRTFVEEVVQTALMGSAVWGAAFMGGASLSLIYAYVLFFDFFKHLGHCNNEFVPASLFHAFPFLRLLLYTPSYHYLHHQDFTSNFCLFMPLYDALGGTLHPNTLAFHLSLRQGNPEKGPDFVFLAHCIDITSSLHVSFMGRTASSMPYVCRWFTWVVSPVGFIHVFIFWAWAKAFVAYDYKLRELHAQTWVIPRYGFHYFLPFGAQSINKLIEEAILDADRLGVKVINLAALNKNEALNGGGTLFTTKHKDLRVRVVHGNTLTAAVILHEIPQETTEVFLTGATSKLGRAIALYLCRKHIRVLMLTSSRERFESIFEEAPNSCKSYLIQVTKYQAGKNCKIWILGKWATEQDQKWAPIGTHFHQFVVPPVTEYREDCTYERLVGMRIPKDTIGLHTCEYVFDRGVIAACHAGGLVHALEGWQHHEVGSIDVDHIDKVWEAALRLGLTPV